MEVLREVDDGVVLLLSATLLDGVEEIDDGVAVLP